jgi:hypothetical protein
VRFLKGRWAMNLMRLRLSSTSATFVEPFQHLSQIYSFAAIDAAIGRDIIEIVLLFRAALLFEIIESLNKSWTPRGLQRAFDDCKWWVI